MHDHDDDDNQLDIGDFPTLMAVSRFARLLENIPWFQALGEPISPEAERLAEDYLSALGFPDARVALVPDWEEAALLAEAADLNSEAWEAEEQLRAGLTAEALELMDEQDLHLAMSHITHQASELVTSAAGIALQSAGLDDEELVRAAAGHAIQACHNAALTLAAGGDPGHPFALKFQLYELGRWPISLTGRSFNLF